MDDDAVVLFGRACDAALSWPRPGGGHTRARFEALARTAAHDLVVGRLVEAHADAVAIAAELGGRDPVAGQRWGVWAAGAPASVAAERKGDRTVLSGHRPWCSGATLLTHALVTADLDGAPLLCAVDLDGGGCQAGPETWTGPGMARADTRTVTFDRAGAEVVGGPASYLERPGFWAGAIGVAACWYGGATQIGRLLLDRLAGCDPADRDPHALAHLGRVDALLEAAEATLARAADVLDDEPLGDHRRLARSARSTVERAATEILDRVGRALGPAPLAHDGRHAHLVADLGVYLRQDHAERDLAALGDDLITGRRPGWAEGGIGP